MRLHLVIKNTLFVNRGKGATVGTVTVGSTFHVTPR